MKTSGILLHISSLPSPHGIGTAGKAAYTFADFLHKAGQSLWQVLPLCPAGYGGSPYSSPSVFAYNPYFIDLDMLIKEGLLKPFDLDDAGVTESVFADYGNLYVSREKILKKAFSRFEGDKGFEEFCRQNAFWLDDYALFAAIKSENGGISWELWDEGLRKRDKKALEEFKGKNQKEITYIKFTQYKFFGQWTALKEYAKKLKIKIIGDMPIYPSYDSSDVWANPGYFRLDKNLLPEKVAGVPPDGFTPGGQLWGNPLYNWGKMEESGFIWWINRLKAALKLFDIVRIDHFRGFESYYTVPYGDKNAVRGKWEKGPGVKLFDAIKREIANPPIIAENLGYLTPEVHDMLSKTGFPGMKVLQFAFDGNIENEYLPHNYNENCVVYTGTHDNDTLYSWYEKLSPKGKAFIRRYLKLKPYENAPEKIMEAAFSSPADTAIIPMQDFLKLKKDARMNMPSQPFGNWKWRMTKGQLNDNLAQNILALTKKYHRNGF